MLKVDKAMEFRKLDFNDIEIKTGVHESEFLKEFLKDELSRVLKHKELKNNKLYIYKSYVYEKEEYIEFGVYIINTSEKDIFIKTLPLAISDGKEKVNKALEVQENIKIGQAIFRELKVNKSLISYDFNLDDLEVLISNLNSLEKYEPIELELNIEPKFRGYITKREFNKFMSGLPRINEESLAINIFKKAYVEDGYFISLVLRNSSSKDLYIETLPIVVTTSNDLIIHESVIKFEKNNCLVPSNKAILKNILIPFEEFPLLPKYNGMDFKVFFKNS